MGKTRSISQLALPDLFDDDMLAHGCNGAFGVLDHLISSPTMAHITHLLVRGGVYFFGVTSV